MLTSLIFLYVGIALIMAFGMDEYGEMAQGISVFLVGSS